MKIDHIEIDNFRNIDHVEIYNFESLLLFGRVGQGKSSILEAVRLCLLGECELTPELGKRGAGGIRPLVRDGAKESCIKVMVGSLLLQLTISKKGEREWFAVNSGTGELSDGVKSIEEFWRYIGVPFDHARIAMMPGRFLLSQEIGDVLAQFLAGDIDPEKLKEITGGHTDWLEEFAAKKNVGSLDSIQKFQDVGAAAYSRRTEVNRDIKDTNRDLEAAGTVVAPTDKQGTKLVSENIPAIQGMIENTREKIAEANVRKGRASVQVDLEAVEEQHLAACDEDRDLGKLLREAQATHEAMTADITEAEAAHATLVSESRSAKSAIRQAQAALDSLTDESGACPTCSRKYTQALKKKLLDPLEKSLKGASDTLQKGAEAVDAALKALAPLRDTAKEARDEVDTIRGKMNVNQHEVARLATLMENAGQQESPQALDAEIADLEATIVRCEDYLVRLGKLKEIEDAKYFLGESEIELGHLNWAIKAFKDGTAIKGLIGDGISEFTAKCNVELEPLGYEMAIEVDEKRVVILLRAPNMEFRPVVLCSTGQQMLAQTSIAFAFSATSGAPVFLDNLNDLDAQFRQKLIYRLKGMTKKDDPMDSQPTVIGAAAWQQSKEDNINLIAQALAPITVAWVNEGGVERQGEVTA